MSGKKTNSSELVAASNVSSSPMNKKRKDRTDVTATAAVATQPSNEVMNALFEQVAVSSTSYTASY